MTQFTKTLKRSYCLDLILRIHEKISNTSAKILGPIVFNIGTKEKGWNLTTGDLLQFPKGTVGNALGEFLAERKMEPLARAEYHDVHHVLFNFSTEFKDEVALQFFLRGNGKTSLASLGVSIGAWCILPKQWSYFRHSYGRGKNCADVLKLNLKELLDKDLDKIKSSLFKKGQL